jgi:hypothetical protein
VISFTLPQLYPGGKSPCTHPLDRSLGRPQGRSGCCGDEKNLLPLPGIEFIFFGHPAHNPSRGGNVMPYLTRTHPSPCRAITSRNSLSRPIAVDCNGASRQQPSSLTERFTRKVKLQPLDREIGLGVLRVMTSLLQVMGPAVYFTVSLISGYLRM